MQQIYKLWEIFYLKQWNHLPVNELLENGFSVFGANWKIGYYDRYMYEEPTVLVSCRWANCGSINLTEPKSWVTWNSIALVPNWKKDIDTNFLYYILKWSDFKNVISGSAQPQIIIWNLTNKTIPLPSLSEQQAIATKLDQLQHLIDLKQQAIAKTDQLAKSIFLEMFGDPMMNEKGWEIIDFGNCIDVLTDYHANGSYENLRDNTKLLDQPDYAYMIRTTDLEHNNFTEWVKYITKEAYEFLSKSKVFGWEILITKIWSAGTIHLMPYLNRPVSLGMNFFMIRTNHKLNNIFAFFYLKTPYSWKIIEWKINWAVTKTITKDAVRTIPFILPPLSLQQQFADIITEIESQKSAHKQALARLKELYQSEMQRSFSI